jgi:TonB family protein
MFLSADPFKLPPRRLAVSLFLHAVALALLCLLGLPSSPRHPRRLSGILLAPALLAPARLAPERERPVPQARKIPVPAHLVLAPPRGVLESAPKLAAPALAPPVLTAPVLISPVLTLPVVLRESPPPPPSILAAGLAPDPALPLTPPVKLGTFDAAEPLSAGTVHRGSSTRVSGFGDAQSPSAPARASILVSNFGVSDFGDTTVANPTRRVAPAAAQATIPVEIFEKPRPAYTDEARRLNIQGEVVLDIAFDASGQVRVLRVIRGLGHGLNETAMAAARQIRFRPARRENLAVDSSAVVHIAFQLAN